MVESDSRIDRLAIRRCRENFPDFHDQIGRLKWLGDEVVAAVHLASHFVEDSIFARKHDNWNRLGAFMLFHEATKFITVEFRHVDVGQNHVRNRLRENIQCVDAVFCSDHFVTFSAEGQRNKLSNGWTIVNDQNNLIFGRRNFRQIRP